MREIPDPGFAGDDGSVDADLASALSSYAADPDADHRDVLVHLQHARLLVPVVATAGEVEYDEQGLARDKTSDMATVSMRGKDGRLALLAFTGVEALRAWNPQARSVPASAARAAASAVQDQADAIVVDVAGPAMFVIPGAALRALADGQLLLRTERGYAWYRPQKGRNRMDASDRGAPEGRDVPNSAAAEFGEWLLEDGVLESLPTDVHFVRYINPDERDDVYAAYLREHGITDPKSSSPAEAAAALKNERRALEEAKYRCLVMYPVDPKYLEPLSERQIRVLHDYYVERLVPCLEAQGHEIGPTPTWEYFIANYEPFPWDPYRRLGPARSGMSFDAYNALRKKCPPRPPDEEMYPDDLSGGEPGR